jgi:hypothetical protein
MAIGGFGPVGSAPVGGLANRGAMSGSTSLSFSTSGNLTGTANLVGSTSLSFATSGTLRGTARLVGSTSLAFDVSGLLKGSAKLIGSTSLTFTVTGTLVADTVLRGVSAFSFVASGTLRGTGKLSGSTSLSFAASGAMFNRNFGIAGAVGPVYDVATVGWGAVRAYPQSIFDFAIETPPRGLPEAVPEPVIVATPLLERDKLARYAEAAAAFDMDLVMKYLAAVGIQVPV